MNATTRQFQACPPNPERGAILLLALVFLLLLAIIVSSVLQSSALQLHMSGNDQFVEQAFNTAQGVAAELSLGADLFPLDLRAGQSLCSPDAAGTDCVSHSLSVARPEIPGGVALEYRITRQEPEIVGGFPFRESERVVSSSNSFDAALFEIEVRVDGSHSKLGSSHVVQGIAERIPATR